MASTSGSNPACPVEGCGIPVDLILQSCDGETIGAHQSNLEHYSEGFPTAGGLTTTETVELTETAAVLRLMLQYTHNIRQPNLKKVQFQVLAGLAEAVEKYTIYSAMDICKIFMELAVQDHPTEVFLYASKHGYAEVADKAAKLTLSVLASDFLQEARSAKLPDSLVIQWYRYREQWANIITEHIIPEPSGAAKLHKGGSTTCFTWPQFQFAVVKDQGGKLDTIERFSAIVAVHRHLLYECTTYCEARAYRWAAAVEGALASIVPFSSV